MSSGSCESLDRLPREARAIVDGARRAVLGTIDGAGRPHLVPVTFAVVGREIVSAVDAKPKRTTHLARLRHIEERPRATVLFDHYADEWSRLGWVMARCDSRIEPPGYGLDELMARYQQYRRSAPEGRVVVLTPQRVTWWLAAG